MSENNYNEIFKSNKYKEWEKAPGKEVIIDAVNSYITSHNPYLLDIGCGTGYLLHRLYEENNCDFNLYGVDSSKEAINIGMRKYPYIHLYCEDGADTHFNDNMFDVIISYGSIEHFSNPEHAIEELSRLLKSGGYFFCMMPSLGIDRTDVDKEGWYEERMIENYPIRQMQWNLYRQTWESYFTKNNLDLFYIDEPKRFGAINAGVFFFGKKR